jgi:hypothetical protein
MTITRFDFYFPGNHAVDAPMTLDGAPLFTRSEKNFYQIRHELLEELYIELGREETEKARALQARNNRLIELAEAGDWDAKRQLDLWDRVGLPIRRDLEAVEPKTVQWNHYWYRLGPCEMCGVEVLTNSQRRSWFGRVIPICSQHCADRRLQLLNRQRLLQDESLREERICRHCGWGFIPEVEDTDYCSRRCKVAAHRAEHSV